MARLIWKSLALCVMCTLCFPVSATLAGGAQDTPSQLRAPRGLQECVVNGTLRLSLADAVRLMLLNNANVRVEEETVEQARDAVTRSYAPFDPQVGTGFTAQRETTPTSSTLQGASTLSELFQDSTATYSETFAPGTVFSGVIAADRTSSNSIYDTFNPNFLSALTFNITQPLLRNFGVFVNRAPIHIAQANLDLSQATFQQQVNDGIQTLITQYWRVVLDRENLQVLKQSLDSGIASYNHDKRALELGALSPLDIYQSEAEAASRRIAVIQAQYALKEDEDQLRMTLGADLDPAYQKIDLDLTEKPKPSEPLLAVDVEGAVKQGLDNRPELNGLQQQLRSNDLNVRVAKNHVLPDLELTGQYYSSGLGGNQLSSAATGSNIISRGGLGQSMGQVFGFRFPTYEVGLQLNLPIHNHSAEANLADARVSHEQTLYEIRRTEEQVRLDVENAVNQLEQAKISISAAQEARDLSQKNVDAQQRKYELGTGLIFLVLQAQDQLASSDSSLVAAQVNYQLSVTALDHATAALIGHYHVQITQAIP